MTQLESATHPQLEELIEAIKKLPREVTYKQIATAANVTENWLTRVVNKKIKDPPFSKILRVRDYLSKLAGNSQQ